MDQKAMWTFNSQNKAASGKYNQGMSWWLCHLQMGLSTEDSDSFNDEDSELGSTYVTELAYDRDRTVKT